MPTLLGACANGDFDRIKPQYVLDDMHAWLGTEAAYRHDGAFSVFPLTDEERSLRDLAFPLIEPPYDRQRWYNIVNEYGATRFVKRDWLTFVSDAYERHLMTTAYRSSNARYAKLNEDIRNDIDRVEPFFVVARHVLDMDARRQKSLTYVGGLTPREHNNAIARNYENALIISWVQCSLSQRAESYRYALEHLLVSTPTPVAVDVDRSLTQMQAAIRNRHLLDEPNVCGPPPAGVAQSQVQPQSQVQRQSQVQVPPPAPAASTAPAPLAQTPPSAPLARVAAPSTPPAAVAVVAKTY